MAGVSSLTYNWIRPRQVLAHLAEALTDHHLEWRTIMGRSVSRNPAWRPESSCSAESRWGVPETEVAELTGLPGWTVRRTAELPADIDGITRWSDRTIWLSDELSGAYARFVLEHEIQHARRGPAAHASSINAEEIECDRGAVEAMWAAGLLVDTAWLDPAVDLSAM